MTAYGNNFGGGFRGGPGVGSGFPSLQDPRRQPMVSGGGMGMGIGSGVPSLPSTPGIGAALSQNGGVGGAVRGAVDGAGRYVKGALDWLTDEEQGAGRLNAIGNFIGTGAGIYGAHQDRKAWREEMERQEREAEEEKKRRADYGPVMGSVLERMFSSANGGGG